MEKSVPMTSAGRNSLTIHFDSKLVDTKLLDILNYFRRIVVNRTDFSSYDIETCNHFQFHTFYSPGSLN
jgi:hypothetical protein